MPGVRGRGGMSRHWRSPREDDPIAPLSLALCGAATVGLIGAVSWAAWAVTSALVVAMWP